MAMIDALGVKRRDALRRMAALVGAADDTAVLAWAAWQGIASLSSTERGQALALIIGMEEIARKTEGREPMFSVEKRRVVKAMPTDGAKL